MYRVPISKGFAGFDLAILFLVRYGLIFYVEVSRA